MDFGVMDFGVLIRILLEEIGWVLGYGADSWVMG